MHCIPHPPLFFIVLAFLSSVVHGVVTHHDAHYTTIPYHTTPLQMLHHIAHIHTHTHCHPSIHPSIIHKHHTSHIILYSLFPFFFPFSFAGTRRDAGNPEKKKDRHRRRRHLPPQLTRKSPPLPSPGCRRSFLFYFIGPRVAGSFLIFILFVFLLGCCFGFLHFFLHRGERVGEEEASVGILTYFTYLNFGVCVCALCVLTHTHTHARTSKPQLSSGW